jgi:hypothetical protein
MYPGGKPVIAYSVPVRPGDLITASVYYDAAAGLWRLALDNKTTGRAVTASRPCPPGLRCGNADAEVITEAPSAGATVPLADFGTETYTAIAVTSRDGTRGSMENGRLWTVHPVGLIGAHGAILASPGPVRRGTAFTDTWHAAQ